MSHKPTDRKKSQGQQPDSYMVRFTCELVFEGDVFVTAKRADAAKAARRHLATLDYKKLSELALRSIRKIQVGRVISERAVRKALERGRKPDSTSPVPSPFMTPLNP